MVKVYGIPNCNTVKKARVLLEELGVEFDFIDFKKTPPNKDDLTRWKAAFGDWPVNKKGPTYRKIKEEFESSNATGKYKLLITTTSAIKRPIIEKNGEVKSFGFNEDEIKSLFS